MSNTYNIAIATDDPTQLLQRDHTLRSGIVVGIDGHIIEIQSRAIALLKKPAPYANVTTISGMTKGAIKESLQRIHGAFSKLGLPESPVQILVNLAPANLPKEGTWLDLRWQLLCFRQEGIFQIWMRILNSLIY